MSSSQAPRDERSRSSSTKPFSLSLGGSSASNGQDKKSSFNLQSSTRTSNPPSRTLARRPHHLHDDESDEEKAPVHEAVTEFDTLAGTAVSSDKKNEKQELVIPVASNNNWRDRAGINTWRPKGKNLLPKEVQAIQEAARRGETAGDNVEREGPSMSYGLSFAQQRSTEQGETGDAPMEDAEPVREEERKPLTQDEIALRALIGESKGEVEARSDLVIESRKADGEADGPLARYDETTSFRADISSRPESATLDQYNAIPVEEFGAALLRGMGWKEGQAVGRGKYGSSGAVDKPRVPERRPGFLGIGAKDVSGGKGAEMELGAWGKSAMRKGARKSGKEGETSTEGVYMPVMMQNKKTGEYITEEELAALQKEAKST
ncbi:hypothetical protein BBP40_012294 [Aspergillus hancockii]|nr:hypothetical protein BBP40_012294 [Aspergillus hancockii]